MKARILTTLAFAAFCALAPACGSDPPVDDVGGAGGAHDGSGAAPAGGMGGQATGGAGTGGGTGGTGTGGEGTGGGTGGIPETCGDGHVDDGEDCDDGEETAACNANCTESTCGDEITNQAAGEECDDGEATASCNADCTDAACGNGVTDDLEECDDGEESADCNADCTEATCGDGVFNQAAGEQCDDAGDSEECNADCTEATCGDDYVNEAAGEECDGELYHNGYALTNNYCIECAKNVCGDGVPHTYTYDGYVLCYNPPGICPDIPWEDCDSGGVDTASCDYDCTTPECGDGHRNPENFEECDDGNDDDDDDCTNGCECNGTPPCQ